MDFLVSYLKADCQRKPCHSKIEIWYVTSSFDSSRDEQSFAQRMVGISCTQVSNVSSLFRNLNSYNTSIPNSEKHVGSQQQCGQTQGSEVGKCFLLKVQSYPLFFPRGELGWHRGLPKNAVSYDEVQHDDDVLQSIEDEANEPGQPFCARCVTSIIHAHAMPNDFS